MVIFAFLILLLRYGYLQLVDHGALLKQSIANYSAAVVSLPARGQILDRNGVVLADNTASYVIAILPKDVNRDSLPKIFNYLSKYVTLSALDKKKFMLQLRNAKHYDWVVIKDDLSDSEIANLTAHAYEFPSIAVFARTKRIYPFNDVYAHSIGYVGRVSRHDKNKLNQAGEGSDYLSSDYIGKSGLEEYYESVLRGALGKKLIKTDANGNEVGVMSNTTAVDGYNIKLTLDNKLQHLAWNLLANNKGAIVALDPQTGGILAFVSKPAFDPNWFIDGISLDDWDDLKHDPNKPLLNRAAQGTYPPGSTFKPFLGIAALFLGIRNPNSTIMDRGYFQIPGSTHKFHDSYPYGRGLIDFTRAIEVSSDTFFYQLGYDMGIDKADSVLPMFGFGQKLAIDFPEDNAGTLPSKAVKAHMYRHDPYNKTWHAADNVVFAIGQGMNSYTPLQMAFATSIIANNGKVIQPHFLAAVLDKNGNVLESYVPKVGQLNIPSSDFTFMQHAMGLVVTNGTASGINDDSELAYTMAGKTGTAQVVTVNHSKDAGKDHQELRDHGWFIAFAPIKNPQIVAAILVENGGWGAQSAVPIARKLFDAYLIKNESLATTNGNNNESGASESNLSDDSDDNELE